MCSLDSTHYTILWYTIPVGLKWSSVQIVHHNTTGLQILLKNNFFCCSNCNFIVDCHYCNVITNHQVHACFQIVFIQSRFLKPRVIKASRWPSELILLGQTLLSSLFVMIFPSITFYNVCWYGMHPSVACYYVFTQ